MTHIGQGSVWSSGIMKLQPSVVTPLYYVQPAPPPNYFDDDEEEDQVVDGVGGGDEDGEILDGPEGREGETTTTSHSVIGDLSISDDDDDEYILV